MIREEKNLKDSIKDINSPSPCKGEGWGEVNFQQVGGLSYTKTNKLITALYMVTDIIDKGEPLRNKLRTLGTEIISDINSKPINVCSKISDIMSFLDIASAVNIVSVMNCNILRKEFLELDKSIKEFMDINSEARPSTLGLASRSVNLSEFFVDSSLDSSSPFRGGFEERFLKDSPHPNPLLKGEGKLNSIGHQYPTRIGVQKGSTLLKALSDVGRPTVQNVDVLKKQRRDDIINIIKTIGGSATIKDIKDRAKILPVRDGSISSCSEKTLQRELVFMVKDGVLKKTGEKRWSRYFLK